MNEENFKKGIKELKNIRMTDAEKKVMLEKVFSSPVASPYMERMPAFALVSSHYTRVILTGCLVVAISFSGVVYGSDKSLPGDLLYPVKTKVVEPVLDVVNFDPEKKIVWEEEKVNRRIVEAEQLLEKDELDDKRLDEIEKSVKKSSLAFSRAADSVASSTGTSTLSRKKKAEDLKSGFRGRINERKFVWGRDNGDKRSKSGSQSEDNAEPTLMMSAQISDDRDNSGDSREEKLKRLKDAAIGALEDDDKDENESGDDNGSEIEHGVETEVEHGIETEVEHGVEVETEHEVEIEDHLNLN